MVDYDFLYSPARWGTHSATSSPIDGGSFWQRSRDATEFQAFTFSNPNLARFSIVPTILGTGRTMHRHLTRLHSR
jgi:hypothetical protein